MNRSDHVRVLGLIKTLPVGPAKLAGLKTKLSREWSGKRPDRGKDSVLGAPGSAGLTPWQAPCGFCEAKGHLEPPHPTPSPFGCHFAADNDGDNKLIEAEVDVAAADRPQTQKPNGTRSDGQKSSLSPVEGWHGGWRMALGCR